MTRVTQNISENVLSAFASLLITGYLAFGDAVSVLIVLALGFIAFGVILAVLDARKGRFSIRRGWRV